MLLNLYHPVYIACFIGLLIQTTLFWVLVACSESIAEVLTNLAIQHNLVSWEAQNFIRLRLHQLLYFGTLTIILITPFQVASGKFGVNIARKKTFPRFIWLCLKYLIRQSLFIVLGTLSWHSVFEDPLITRLLSPDNIEFIDYVVNLTLLLGPLVLLIITPVQVVAGYFDSKEMRNEDYRLSLIADYRLSLIADYPQSLTGSDVSEYWDNTRVQKLLKFGWLWLKYATLYLLLFWVSVYITDVFVIVARETKFISIESYTYWDDFSPCALTVGTLSIILITPVQAATSEFGDDKANNPYHVFYFHRLWRGQRDATSRESFKEGVERCKNYTTWQLLLFYILLSVAGLIATLAPWSLFPGSEVVYDVLEWACPRVFAWGTFVLVVLLPLRIILRPYRRKTCNKNLVWNWPYDIKKNLLLSVYLYCSYAFFWLLRFHALVCVMMCIASLALSSQFINLEMFDLLYSLAPNTLAIGTFLIILLMPSRMRYKNYDRY